MNNTNSFSSPNKATSKAFPFITLWVMLTVALLFASPSYADSTGSETGTCVGGSCPVSYPQGPSVYGTVQGQDEAYSAVIGGNWTLGGGAAEGEGRIVVLGDVNMNKTGGDINTGFVGAGSWVVPPDNSVSLTIGGDVNFNGNNGDNIIYGGVAGVDNIPLQVVYKGTLNSVSGGTFEDGSFPQNGVVSNNAALDLAPYQSLLDAAVSRSQCWVGMTQSANAQFTDGGGGNYTFNSTNGASGLYVFTLNQDLDPGFGSSLTFTNFPDDATILINVLGATRSLNITNVTVNGTAMGTGSFTAEPLAEQILWNFPTATAVTLNGSSQFWGSVVAPQADVTLGTSTNGRLLIGGDLNQGTVSGAGLELHNYPFNGSLPTCDRGDLPDTGAGTGAGNYATLVSDNGPTHIVTSTTPRLGACVDGESDGQQGTTASGDNSNGSDAIDTTALDSTHVNVQGTCGASGDEDGVVVAAGSGAGGLWQDGANGGSIDVVGTTGACLNGWIDWNGNGSFLDANEQVASNVALTGASQNIQFTVPAGTFTGIGPNINLHARYRVTQNCGTNDYINPSTGTAVAPSPDGPANNGEVEDYLWSFTPTAVELQQVAGTTSNHPSTAVLFTLTSLLLITALFVLRRASQRF